MDWPFTRVAAPWMPRSRLLELPPEIRDLIYEYVLTSEKPVVTFRLDNYQSDSYQEATQPALTRISKQVRHESLSVYFDCNNFIMHTEGSKVDQARQWLQYNQDHIPKLRRLSLWVRYVTLTNDRSGSNGALSIGMQRDVRDLRWKVDDEWKWITVVRKPTALESDARFLIAELRGLLEKEATSHLDARGFAGMLTDLRMLYVREKMS